MTINPKNTKFYCPIPFYSIEINTTDTAKLCCVSSRRYKTNMNFLEFWNSEEMENIRYRMLNDEEDSQNCGACYLKEKNYNDSKRLDEIKYGEQQGITYTRKTNFPTHLQIKITNVCNLKCIMCSPHYSTKWNEDVDKLKHMRTKLTKTKAEVLDKSYLKKLITLFLNNKSLVPKKIELYGGEPMLAKNFWKTIENVEPLKLKNVNFLMNTNGTILTDDHLKNFIKFKKCIINLSIDGIEDVFEYVRFPAKWNVVEKNIKKLYAYKRRFSNRFELGLYFTLSSFSAPGLPKFIEYCNRNKYNYYINLADIEPEPTEMNDPKIEEMKKNYTTRELYDLGLVYNPTSVPIGFSHPSVLPENIKSKIIKDVESRLNTEDKIFYSRNLTKIKNSLSFDDPNLEKMQKKFLLYCDLIKEVRGVDFKIILSNYESQ